MRSVPILLLALLDCTVARHTEPRTVVDQFYTVVRTEQVSGAPTAAQLAVLAPYLTDSLRALLAAAGRRHDADVARAPDEKPLFADGSLFSSLFEGPTSFQVIEDSARGPDHAVRVTMTNTTSQPATTWVDVVLVTEQRGQWVIGDIEYGGTWDFAPRGTLAGQLRSALTAP